MHSRIPLMSAVLLLGLTGAASAAHIVTAYTNDFDGNEVFGSGIAGGLSGITSTTSVQSLPSPFSGNLLRNTTGNIFGTYGPDTTPITATTLTLTGLPEHKHIDILFLFAALDSWDGLGFPGGPDRFNVVFDGVTIFSHVFTNIDGTSDYSPPPGVLLSGPAALGFNSTWPDSAFDLGADQIFRNIAHSSDTLTLSFFASTQGLTDGTGWQGGTDESWGIDNLQVILRIDEPQSSAMLTMALICALLAFSRAKTRLNDG